MKQAKKSRKNPIQSTEEWMPFNDKVKSFLTSPENEDVIRISTSYLKKCRFKIEHGDTIFISTPVQKDYDYLYVMGYALKADEVFYRKIINAPFGRKVLRLWWD